MADKPTIGDASLAVLRSEWRSDRTGLDLSTVVVGRRFNNGSNNGIMGFSLNDVQDRRESKKDNVEDSAEKGRRGRKTEWQRKGKCYGQDTTIFYPLKHENFKLDKAREFCVGCPVRFNCLEYGLDEKYGVWGGFTVKKLRKIKKNRLLGYGWKKAISKATGLTQNSLTWVKPRKIVI